MKDWHSTVEEIRVKVRQLLQEKERLAIELAASEQRIRALQDELGVQKNTITELEEKNKIVKLAESLRSSGGDVQELKKKLRDYIRDIDECIRLLSDR